MFVIGENELTKNEIAELLFKEELIVLSELALDRVRTSHEFLSQFIKGKIIYGINTGLGPMAQYKIADSEMNQLQYNLIRSHVCGDGELLQELYIRAIMIARLNSLMKGYSGVHPDLVILLAKMINLKIYPCIYEHGGVGASGDLVQLAHLAYAMLGEGKVLYNNEVRDTAEIFKQHNLQALTIHIREGLAILNGTSAMTGIGILNLIYAKNLIHWSIVATCIINEIIESFNDHFSEELNSVKLHSGQYIVAEIMRTILHDSKLIRKRDDILYNNYNGLHNNTLDDRVQEFYSIRCVPQILGPIYDAMEYTDSIVCNEINSVNDNPIIDIESKNVYHGGNFHGDYVAFEMDKLKIAVTKMTMLAERQINFLLNNNLNKKLTPFCNLGKLGLNLGMQGLQFTAVSTTAENQTMAFPMYLHSISCNNDNQDIVSMGFNAALLTRKVIDNAATVLAVEFMAIINAIELLNIKDKLSSINQKIINDISTVSPAFYDDIARNDVLKNVKNYIKCKNLS